MRYKTQFNGYSLAFSPFVEGRLAVTTSQNFGIIGKGMGGGVGDGMSVGGPLTHPLAHSLTRSTHSPVYYSYSRSM